MLYDDANLEQAMEEFMAAGPQKGTIFVNCATVYPLLTQNLAQKAEKAGVTVLSCPIFGRPDAIAAHKGLCVSGGPEGARQRAKPLLDAIGQGILDVGDEAKAGAAMKLVGNFFIVSIIELLAEGMTLAEKNGVQRQHVVQFIETLFPGHIFKGYANSVANDKFVRTKADPGFPLIGGLKDVGHMQQLGKDSGASMPVVDIIMQHMRQVQEMGGGDFDWSAMALALRKKAHLSVSPLG
ncbi:hypothetical protein CVIRNUC_000566 [Coccomyxa viridis]|uniref:Uncharacterized protein n=1 Tax=Coccomyxa viridis TaxID=1274662 RepID=A0AAV1HRH9_9CHLO|nr:hypothetical protein CVIRNUC_000566 [Coccomyxa viridis]